MGSITFLVGRASWGLRREQKESVGVGEIEHFVGARLVEALCSAVGTAENGAM